MACFFMDDLIKDLKSLERHDKLIALAVILLLLAAWSMVQGISAAEARQFLRFELIDLALLLLMADIVIHLGKIERKIYSEEKKIEQEIKEAVVKKRKRR